ncbi:MAG: ABC-2 family transporter protein [Clostridia bacterium]|nr:ABC-2 family transporter protein [Clostridia bacterium]
MTGMTGIRPEAEAAGTTTTIWARLSRAARVYRTLVSASTRGQMQYRLDFLGSTLVQAVMGADSLLFIGAILWRFGPVMGWGIFDIGMLFAVSRMGNGIYMLLCNELDAFEAYMVNGDFDTLMIRPWPTLFTLLARGTGIRRLSFLVQGVAAGAIAAPRLATAGVIRGWDFMWVLASVVWTTLLFFAVGLATAAAGFWIVRIEELQVFTLIAPSTATMYPLDVYPSWLRRLFVTVLPLGLGSYVPLRFILDKGGTVTDLLWPALASPVAVWLALKLWKAGEAHYASTGT